MKLLFLSLLLTSFLGPLHAETIVGVVNINKVLETVQEGKSIKLQIQKFIEEKRAILRVMEKRTKLLSEKIEKQSIQDSIGDTSQRDLKELSLEISEKSEVMQKDLEKFEADLINPLKQRVASIIREVSLKNGVDLTTDSSTQNFVYIAREKDLTDEVIRLYDQKYSAKGSGAK